MHVKKDVNACLKEREREGYFDLRKRNIDGRLTLKAILLAHNGKKTTFVEMNNIFLFS